MENDKMWAFSLIEILVTVAVLAILAAVAVPSYKTYVTRSQIMDGAAIASRVKNFTNAYYLKYGKMPLNTDLAKEFGATVVSNKIAVSSVATDYIGYDPIYKTDRIYSVIQMHNPIPAGSTRTNFFIGIKDNANGSFLIKCGIWNISAPAATDIIDLSYFPKGCNDTDVYTAWQ